MQKKYWYTKVTKSPKTKEKGLGTATQLIDDVGSDVVYLLKALEKENKKINIQINTEKFDLNVYSVG